MTHHIILWKLKDELTQSQKAEIKKSIKEGLEGLAGKIPGLLSIKVNTEGLSSSNVDLMLDSTFDSPESLKGYSVKVAHYASDSRFAQRSLLSLRSLMTEEKRRG